MTLALIVWPVMILGWTLSFFNNSGIESARTRSGAIALGTGALWLSLNYRLVGYQVVPGV